MKPLDSKLLQIAQQNYLLGPHVHGGTFSVTGAEQLDVHPCHVDNIKRALTEAFELGRSLRETP